MGDCQQVNPTLEDLRENWELDPRFEALKAIWGPRLRDMMELKICEGALLCGPKFFQELTVGLNKCVAEFYKLCDFDRLIHICPFDPAWDAFDWKQKVVSERLQVLEVQVKELQAKLPTGK